MKTLSVKQVADVLGVSPRAVLKRLSVGQLKGTRRTNKYGVEEWWVYPNKEIRSSLEATGRIDILGDNESLSDAEVVEVDGQNFAPDEDFIDEEVSSSHVEPGSWSGSTRGATNGVAEELWNNIISRFLGELKERDQLIGEMRSELADKDRQLKLLPDLEKQAEAERKTAELKELESEALRKQIAAMQEKEQVKVEEIERLNKVENEILPELQRQLDRERIQKEQELAEAQRQVEILERDKRESEASKLKVEELERTLIENQRKAEEELERLRQEKEAQTLTIQEQLQALSSKLDKAQEPWWKKWFAVPKEQ